MNQEYKQKWCEALRGGEYKQGKGRLKGECPESGNTVYCCLGVLLDIYDPTKWFGTHYLNHGDWFNIPRCLLPVFGLNDTETKTLANMNDDHQSFESIADYIENYI